MSRRSFTSFRLDGSTHASACQTARLPSAPLTLFLVTDKKKITVSASALEACEGAAAVVIATEWDEFKSLDWTAVYAKMSKPAFVVSRPSSTYLSISFLNHPLSLFLLCAAVRRPTHP